MRSIDVLGFAGIVLANLVFTDGNRIIIRVTSRKCATMIQCAFRCRLASRRFQKEKASQKEKAIAEERLLRTALQETHDANHGSSVQRTVSGDGPPVPNDRLRVLKRWRGASLLRCFTQWKTFLMILHERRQRGKSMVKSLMFGMLYTYFGGWRQVLAVYGDKLTPWRSYAGQLVALSKEGREYEFLNGQRMDGDTECGVLVESLLTDKTLWKVRWLSSGKMGTYLTGSNGRYHLSVWKVKSKDGVEETPAAASHDDQKGMTVIREALLNSHGIKMTLNVTAPFGGNINMPCPRNSPWSIRVQFPPHCVRSSAMIQIQGVEAGNYDAIKTAFGNIVSPVVEVRSRQDLQCFKAYKLVIPNRVNSTKHLALFHWPDNRSGAERILHNITFDDDYCTTEVDYFGIFCVVAVSAAVNEIIYAKLVFPGERRDVTGRQLVSVQMSTPFQGVVYAYPKAFLEPPSGLPAPTSSQWMTMPRFCVNPITHFESVKVMFASKMEGCKVTSWSGRARWRNRPLMINFEGIIQPVPGQSFGDKTPIVGCNCWLMEEGSGDPAVKFAGPHFFRMEIQVLLFTDPIDCCFGTCFVPSPCESANTNVLRMRCYSQSVRLKVLLLTQSGHSEAYVRMLQARENLLDIRKWIAKASLVEKCSVKSMQWLKSLRFFHEGEVLSLQEEKLQLAAMVMPAIEMRPVSTTHEHYGTPEQVAALESMMKEELRVPYNGPEKFSSYPPPMVPGHTTPFIGGGTMLSKQEVAKFRSKLRRFGQPDALLLGTPWRAPDAKALATAPSITPRTPRQRLPKSEAIPRSPTSDATQRWSPRVKIQIPQSPPPLDSPSGPASSGHAHKRKFRPYSASSAGGAIAAAQRPLDQYLSFRPSHKPPEYISNPESVPKSVAEMLLEDHSTVVPRRPASARFHSGRQMRTLDSKAKTVMEHTQEALRLQIVHAPGKTVNERQSDLHTILTSPDIVSCLHLDTDGTVKYVDADMCAGARHVPQTRKWRPASARPYRIPIPNYLLHDAQ